MVEWWLILSPHSLYDPGSNPPVSQVPFCVEFANTVWFGSGLIEDPKFPVGVNVS